LARPTRRFRLAEAGHEIAPFFHESERIVEREDAEHRLVPRLARNDEPRVLPTRHLLENLLGFGEDALGGDWCSGQLGVLSQEILLLLRRGLRDADADANDEVSPAAAIEPPESAPAQPDLGSGLRAARDRDLLVLLEGRHRDLSAEDERGIRDLER